MRVRIASTEAARGAMQNITEFWDSNARMREEEERGEARPRRVTAGSVLEFSDLDASRDALGGGSGGTGKVTKTARNLNREERTAGSTEPPQAHGAVASSAQSQVRRSAVLGTTVRVVESEGWHGGSGDREGGRVGAVGVKEITWNFLANAIRNRCEWRAAQVTATKEGTKEATSSIRSSRRWTF